MGATKVKWSREEEDALREGVRKYGLGKWRAIQKDPEFERRLVNRTNVDLKDKWRNMSAAAQEGPRAFDRAAKEIRGESVLPISGCAPALAGSGSSPPRAARPALAGGGSSPPRAARPALAPTKFNTVVRGKARAALPAFECAACSKFYAVAGLDMATYCKCDVSQKKMPRLQDTSRHRARYEAPADPPGFWDLDPPGFELRPDDWPGLKALDA